MHTTFINSCLCNFQQMIRLNYHRRIEVSLSRFFNVFRNFSDVLHYGDILKLAYSKEQANRTWIPLNQQYRNWKKIKSQYIFIEYEEVLQEGPCFIGSKCRCRSGPRCVNLISFVRYSTVFSSPTQPWVFEVLNNACPVHSLPHTQIFG